MDAYPLKHLTIYMVKKDFTSDRGISNADAFRKHQRIQYQKNISDIRGMMEIVYFKDMDTKKELVWRTSVENLHDHWREYLMVVKKKLDHSEN